MVTIDLKKRDLWILTALIFFLIGVGLVIGFGDYRTGNPKVMGHSSDEIMVLNSSGAEITLQNYINNTKSGLNIEIALGFRLDDNNNKAGTIVTISGNSNAFVPLDDKAPAAGSLFSSKTTLDGLGCANGWKIVGCWEAASGTGEDLYTYKDNSGVTGCLSGKYDTEKAELSVACVKVS